MSTLLRSLLLFVFLCIPLFAEGPGEVFQVSTLDALSSGVFQGLMRVNGGLPGSALK